MRETSDVSVVLPFFNGAQWLSHALRSLARQTCQPMEIIVVDDGSTDGGAQLIEADGSGLPLRLIRHESNLGIVASLNHGLDAAKGRYVARMDADDICLPQRLERQVAFLEQTGADVCGSWFVEFGQGLARTVRWPHTEPAVKAAMLFQNSLCHPTVVARRQVFERYRYREEYRLTEDYDLFGRALAEFRIANVPEVLLRYRRHHQQATQSKRDAMEAITKRVRLEVLEAQHIAATVDEQRLHNMIRAPQSITDVQDLVGIETWLRRLLDRQQAPDAKRVVASQWIRACIRAAPLGMRMWRAYRTSPLHSLAGATMGTAIDLAALAATRLDYRSAPFAVLRRLGLSA